MAGTINSNEGFSKDELNFIKSPPEEIEIECRICFQVMLDDPHLVTCCGHHFCKSCIERWKIANKPCPLCNKKQIQNVPDKGRHRIINGLRVYCTNQGEGCQWEGDIKNLPAHLNRGEREGECQYEKVTIACRFKCQKKVQRRNLKIHEKQECTQRPYKCKFCGQRGSYEMITQQHYNECIECPIHCSNCQLILDRHKVDYHMSNECLLRLVDCAFKWAGCQQKLPHKHIHQHNIDSHEDHMLLSINFYKKESDMFKEKCQMLRDENYQLKLKMKNLKKELQTKQKLYLQAETKRNNTQKIANVEGTSNRKNEEEIAKRIAEETAKINAEATARRITEVVTRRRRRKSELTNKAQKLNFEDFLFQLCVLIMMSFVVSSIMGLIINYVPINLKK